MDEASLKNIVAKNIAACRKQAGMTQLQLAEKLNYSDKAVSKWERAEALPDAFVLKTIADLFNVRIDDLMSEHVKGRVYIGISIEKRILLPIMVSLAILILATVLFSVFMFKSYSKPWLCFIYAVPVCALSFLIFCMVWKKRLLITISSSIFVWTLAFLLFMTTGLPDKYTFFIIAVPIQAFIIIWYFILHFGKKHRK